MSVHRYYKNLSPSTRFILLALVGTALRLAASTMGWDWDMGFWRRITDAIAAGQLYKTNDYYVYGPGSAIIFYLLDLLPHFGMSPFLSLRYKIAIMLTLADIAIAYLLWRKYSIRAAALMLLNPISIIITGYHSQIDNLYVLCGLIAVRLMRKDPQKIPYAGLTILGASFIIKHGLMLFPIWLAIKALSEKTLRTAVASVYIPYLLFLYSFVPFCMEPGMLTSVWERVFGYGGTWHNGTFWVMLRHGLPWLFQQHWPTDQTLMTGTLLILGFLWRKRTLEELLLFYLISLITFTSGLADQYFTIACIVIAVYPNIFFIVYSLLGGIYFAGASEELHIEWVAQMTAHIGDKWVWYSLLIKLLFMGLVLMQIKTYWRNRKQSSENPVTS